ncbi:SGNH hydrolase domain-containing protein [Streptomyces sp. NPDC093982]|uniref:DUF459 domain-containing protein n=1 Tax=Streptomyces sp. NPDC093982 TaxID=3155077 RepID=UPI00343292BB
MSSAVQRKTVLVVGDSWAGSIAKGMDKVASDSNVIVNAGLDQCGIMLPYSQAGGKKPPATCLEWPVKWSQYMKKHKPDAVLLRTANWDMTPQAITKSGADRTISHPAFRKRFNQNMNRAIDILTENGTPVYITNTPVATGKMRKVSLAMNEAIQGVADKGNSRGVYLLDLSAEMCNDNGCPLVADGHKVYDEKGRPTSWSRDRIARWALNAMFAHNSADASQ